MARSSMPNSAGSQFFIVTDDSTFLDGTVPKEYCVDHSNVKENVIVNENTNSVDSENVFEQ